MNLVALRRAALRQQPDRPHRAQRVRLIQLAAGADWDARLAARHGHRRDEECLMLEGELFLDDLLLRRGDYQIAPAGTEHGAVLAETGVLLFAHGDVALDVLSA